VEIKEYFDDLGARIKPDLVLVPRTDDLHQDHRVTAELAVQTFRAQPILHYELIKYEGDLATPNVYVPVTADQLERKITYLAEAFVSQAGRYWFRPETFRGLAAVRGVESRAASGFAEGFHARKLVVDG
jgi:LmbE family N-acetylglucosaminyl deacetylase